MKEHRTNFRVVGGLLCLLLASCVSMTEPVAMGDNKYLLTLNARGGFQSDGELLARSVQKANEFCRAQGRHAEIASTQTSGVQMWTPQNNQVVFSCL